MASSLFAFVLLLDLLTKGLIIPNLIPNVGDSIPVLNGFVNFIYVQNTGAAWGMLAGRPVFLIVISIIVLGLLIAFYVLRTKKLGERVSILFGISIGLVVGGCIGNLVDRIIFGYVRDFINFQFVDFPVFNFADVALTVGVIVMLVYFVFFYSKEEEYAKQNQQRENFLNGELNGEAQADFSNDNSLDLDKQKEQMPNKQNDGENKGEDNEG